MNRIVLIGIAGLMGTLGRYWLSGLADERLGGRFPVGTVLVNLIGCFAVGFLFHLTAEKYVIDPTLRTAILVGFLGGFTTFSSFGIQTFNLFRDGQMLLAGANILVSNVAGLLLVWAGYAAARGL